MRRIPCYVPGLQPALAAEGDGARLGLKDPFLHPRFLFALRTGSLVEHHSPPFASLSVLAASSK